MSFRVKCTYASPSMNFTTGKIYLVTKKGIKNDYGAFYIHFLRKGLKTPVEQWLW